MANIRYKTTEHGKGDCPRHKTDKNWQENYDAIFRKAPKTCCGSCKEKVFYGDCDPTKTEERHY